MPRWTACKVHQVAAPVTECKQGLPGCSNCEGVNVRFTRWQHLRGSSCQVHQVAATVREWMWGSPGGSNIITMCDVVGLLIVTVLSSVSSVGCCLMLPNTKLKFQENR